VRATSQTLPPEPTQSVFRVIFDHAWKRLGNSRLLTFWETVIWSAFAAHWAYDIFGLYSAEIDSNIAVVCFVLAAVLTILLIGPCTYQVYSSGGSGDEILRLVVPVKPQVIVGARMAAVGAMWARVAGPLVITGIHLVINSSAYSSVLDRWSIVSTISRYHEVHISFLSSLGMILMEILLGLALLAIPLTWAAYWGTRVARIGVGFFLGNALVLIPLLIIFFMIFMADGIVEANYFQDYPFETLARNALVGLSLVLLVSAILGAGFFNNACRSWGARDK